MFNDCIQFSEKNVKDLKLILKKVKGDTFGEIGCWTGHSTSYIAEEAMSRNGIVHVVDCFLGNQNTKIGEKAKKFDICSIFKENMKNVGCLDFITTHVGFSSERAPDFKDEFFDFLFIDGDHTYKGLHEDIIAYLPKMKKTGIIAGHDFESFDYDINKINVDFYNGKHNGVIKAVTDRFGGLVSRRGSLWYVEINKMLNDTFFSFITRLLKNAFEPEYKYSNAEYDFDWMDRKIKPERRENGNKN